MTGSVHENADSPFAMRRLSIRSRSSVTWTVLKAVTPASNRGSVKTRPPRGIWYAYSFPPPDTHIVVPSDQMALGSVFPAAFRVSKSLSGTRPPVGQS